jgi:hypothetical protein
VPALQRSLADSERTLEDLSYNRDDYLLTVP